MTTARECIFQSRLDGEYVMCRNCARNGYGEDAWHPATVEYFRDRFGKLQFAACRACESEREALRRGTCRASVMPDDFKLEPRTAPYARNFGADPVCHGMVTL